MHSQRFILLSFDVEEFDIPLEYKQNILPQEQMIMGKMGLDVMMQLLQQQDIATTLFTTANFAVHFPSEIKQLSASHEIGSHTYFHSSFQESDLLSSRKKLEEITGTNVCGLRMPRLRPVDMKAVKDAGYLYDSSINPTYLPGRYDNRHLPRTVYLEESVLRVPASVSPGFRIPLFWLAFKNFPYWFYKKLALQTLKKDGYLCIYFHPWELVSLADYDLPFYIKKHSGQRMTDALNRLINDLKKEGDFVKMKDLLF